VWQVPAVLSWVGARGVVPLAAALSIPLTDAAGLPVPHRDVVLVLAIAVIVISLIVQGFTLAPLVRLAGLAVPTQRSADAFAEARIRVADAGLAQVDELAAAEDVAPELVERLRLSLENRVELFRDGADNGDGADVAYRRLRRAVYAAESEELRRLYAGGAVDEGTRRRLQRQLDVEEARFTDDH
jgi:CPA1 family monovalent cation:H+ antiporter